MPSYTRSPADFMESNTQACEINARPRRLSILRLDPSSVPGSKPKNAPGSRMGLVSLDCAVNGL